MGFTDPIEVINCQVKIPVNKGFAGSSHFDQGMPTLSAQSRGAFAHHVLGVGRAGLVHCLGMRQVQAAHQKQRAQRAQTFEGK